MPNLEGRMTNQRQIMNHEASPLRSLPACIVSLCRLSSFLAFASIICAEPLQIQLVSEVPAIQPGKPFYIGLHLKHKEHYHTYWKFPGIVGVPTDMAWKLPQGWKAEPIEWPEPERVMMFQIKAQGFEGEVLLPMKLTPPDDLTTGTKVTLSGKATWMCCGQDCNPGFADLAITLPVSGTASAPDKQWCSLFARARESAAQPADGWVMSASRSGDTITLRMVAQSEAAKARAEHVREGTFFTEDGFINADKPQTFAKEAPHTIVMKLMVSQYFQEPPPENLLGLLQSPQGWGNGGRGRSVLIRAKIENRKE